MDIKMKLMSYEECRADFFINLIRHAENKIKYWKRQTGYRCEIDDNLSNAGAEMQYCQDALKALEKQTPKKVIFTDNGESLLCPKCGFNLMGSINEPDHDPYYCFECGQALDWSDDERTEGEK